MENLKNLKNIIFNKRFINSTLVVFFLGFISTILEIIGLASIPLLFTSFYDPESLKNTNFLPEYLLNLVFSGNLLLNFSILVSLIFLLKNSILSFIYYIENSFCKKVNLYLINKFYKIYINSPYKLIYNHNSSSLIRYILQDTQQTTIFIQNFIIFVREVSLVILIAVYLFYSNFLTSLIIVLFLIFSVMTFYSVVRKKLNKFSENIQKIEKKQIQNINQLFTSIEFLKSTNKENFFSNKFNDLTGTIEQNRFYINFLNRVPKLFLEIAAVASIVITVVVFSFFYDNQKIILSYLVILGVSTVRLIPAFNLITSSLIFMKTCSVSINRLNQELVKYGDKPETDVIKNRIIEKNTFPKKLLVKDLSFKYENEDNYAFKNLNFSLENNETLLIVGESGSGKTTLIRNLLGLLEPTNGKIMLDNQNIFLDLNNWRSKIGYIPQRVFLNDDTILNNIAFGFEDERIDIERVDECIRLADLDDFINSLKEKKFTKMDKIESQISGGQLQRIGIARALYSNPMVLIMDEPTSSVDEKTEEKILKSIKGIKSVKFKIIVSHRKKTSDFSDKIISLSN